MECDQLWRLYKETGDHAAREELILRHAFLVRCVADRLGLTGSAGVDRDDLISYGIIGLIDAVEKYDACPGRSFESYARLHIRGAILNAIGRGGSSVGHGARRADAIERACVTWQRLGRHFRWRRYRRQRPQRGGDRAGADLHRERWNRVAGERRPLEEASDSLILMPPVNNHEAPSPADPGSTGTPSNAASSSRDPHVASERTLSSASLHRGADAAGDRAGDEPDRGARLQIHTKAMMRLRAHLRTQADLFAAA